MKPTALISTAAILSAAVLAAGPTAVVFGAVVNDGCAGAIALTNGFSYSMPTADATSLNDPVPTCQTNFGRGVWFTFTPSSDGVAIIDSCDSSFNTAIEVFTGNCCSLIPVADTCNRGPGLLCFSNRASTAFTVAGGITYFILAGGQYGGAGTLTIHSQLFEPPSNDRCVGAIPLNVAEPYRMSTLGATSDGDPSPSCLPGFGRGVWFTFVAPSNAVAAIATEGSDFETVVEAYTGNCGGLVAVPDSCDGGYYRGPSTFKVTEGTMYWVLVGGSYGRAGSLRIQLDFYPVPPNDFCTNRIVLSDAVPYSISTFGASATGDPVSDCATGNGVWFDFTPTTNGVVVVSSCQRTFDIGVEAFTGDCSALKPVPGSCNSGFEYTCTDNQQTGWSFQGVAGVTYHILVRNLGRGGMLTIQADVYQTPTNDRCGGAIPLVHGMPRTIPTFAATALGNPISFSCTYLQRSIWFSFTPERDGVLVVTTCGSSVYTALEAYEGDCSSLIPVPGSCSYDGLCSDPYRAGSVFGTKAGKTYYILTGGDPDLAGFVTVRAWLHPIEIRESFLIANEGFQLNLSGLSNATYSVYASTNLANWTRLGAPVQISPGIFRFSDHAATNYPMRFYQVRFP